METPDPLRVLIVDDSRIFRGVIQSSLEAIADVQVIGSVFNGEKALTFIAENWPDLVTLDIEMPGMDGLQVLQAIGLLNAQHAERSNIDVVLVSSLTTRGARCTIQGLQLGAIDFILKPSGDSEASNLAELGAMLREKVSIVRAKRRLRNRSSIKDLATGRAPSELESSALASTSLRTADEAPRPFHALAIGISTGGPEALNKALPSIADQFSAPIFIVQHILPGFSSFLAESLSRHCRRAVVEASEGKVVEPDGIYLAPSQSHMVLRRRQNEIVIGASDAPPENGCRPSADVLFRSAATTYGTGLIACVMTGMGSDGAAGAVSVSRAGGYVIAQNEATSTVWGMPRAAVETGVVNAVLPLDQIAIHLGRMLRQRV